MISTLKLSNTDRSRTLRSLREAEKFIQGLNETIDAEALALVDQIREEARRIEAANTALVLALLADEYTPIGVFSAWASKRRVREWKAAGKISTAYKNGKLCIRPSEFFRHWRTLES